MTIICSECGDEYGVGAFPFCKGIKGQHRPGANSVSADDIPGGLEIRNGLCWPDGSPRKWYSHSAIRAEAKRMGLVNRVEHIPVPGSGSDKSKFTTRWS
jgi:hypothetical protein